MSASTASSINKNSLIGFPSPKHFVNFLFFLFDSRNLSIKAEMTCEFVLSNLYAFPISSQFSQFSIHKFHFKINTKFE